MLLKIFFRGFSDIFRCISDMFHCFSRIYPHCSTGILRDVLRCIRAVLRQKRGSDSNIRIAPPPACFTYWEILDSYDFTPPTVCKLCWDFVNLEISHYRLPAFCAGKSLILMISHHLPTANRAGKFVNGGFICYQPFPGTYRAGRVSALPFSQIWFPVFRSCNTDRWKFLHGE